MADACARAAALTGDGAWRRGRRPGRRLVRRRQRRRRRDVGSADTAAATTASHATGPNLNQGAESTLALISTLPARPPAGAGSA